MSGIDDRAAVRAALQAGYGDASQTVLDDRVAGDVLATLRARGWASLDEIAVLIEAAGGSITVPDSLLADRRERVVERSQDLASMSTRFTVRSR